MKANPSTDLGQSLGLFDPYLIEACPPADSRMKILCAAYIEIHEVGFQAASISRILRSTGLTKGALYHHFPSKLELGYAVIDEVIEPQLRAHWVEPLRDCRDPVATLSEILRHSEQTITDRDVELGCPVNNLAQEMSPVDEGFRRRIDGLLSLWRGAIKTALENGVEAGTISREVDPTALAVMFVATLEGCIGAAKSAQNKALLSQCGDSLIMLIEKLRV
ncbi:MAG: TetR/AcrR family transcriptional regulator [bacterium]